MKNLLIIPLLIFAVLAQAADKGYITDEIMVMVRSGEGMEFKIINRLSSGTAVTVLGKNAKTGYTRIRMKNGKEGWVLSRYLTDKPIARWLLKSATKKLEKSNNENVALKQNLQTLQSGSADTLSKYKQLYTQSEQLNQELKTIRQTAADAIRIQSQRDQLQERVVGLERELQKVKRDKQSLEDSTEQDWFMIGAGVLIAGIILGLILPRISWRRKTTSWDSF